MNIASYRITRNYLHESHTNYKYHNHKNAESLDHIQRFNGIRSVNESGHNHIRSYLTLTTHFSAGGLRLQDDNDPNVECCPRNNNAHKRRQFDASSGSSPVAVRSLELFGRVYIHCVVAGVPHEKNTPRCYRGI